MAAGRLPVPTGIEYPLLTGAVHSWVMLDMVMIVFLMWVHFTFLCCCMRPIYGFCSVVELEDEENNSRSARMQHAVSHV